MKMFWNKKSSIEKQKELQLVVLQLEKQLERVIVTANNAILAFDRSSKKDKHVAPRESAELVAIQVFTLTEFMSSRRFIEQNIKTLSEMAELIKNKRIQMPFIIQDNFSIVRKKHDEAYIMFSVLTDVMSKEKHNDLASFLARKITLYEDLRTDLLHVVNSTQDFQDLFRKHFSSNSFDYVHLKRLEQLRSIEIFEFDLSKLIRLCEELNSVFHNQNYLSVAMLVRSILDHVPPIFGYKTFGEVANNYGGKSLKKSLQNLQNSSRHIADAHLHEPIRQKESLPNETQVDFRNDLDVLLSEVVRVLK